MMRSQITRVKHFNLDYNQRDEKNRARVRKHRYFRKLKTIHEKKIYEQLYSEKNVNIDAVFDDCLEFDPNEVSPNVDKVAEIKYRLKHWAVNHRITKTALNDLLWILRHAGLPLLKDSRTLMGTPVNVPIESLSNGKLWHCGIRTCIQHVFAGVQRNISITLHFNFDGVPIAKSSNKQFWPILCSINGSYYI